MDTIKTYLENMFVGLPGSTEVLRAKSELMQMMEDKYIELKEEGLSDNEAVGRVISEFGNLEELADELGIDSVVREAADDVDRRIITEDEAEKYISARKKNALIKSIGIAFCIMSVIPPIMMEAFDWPDAIGVAGMFSMVAIGVILIVISAAITGKWDYLDKELCMLEPSSKPYFKELFEKKKISHAIAVAIGVACFIMSVIPAAVMDEIDIDGIHTDELGGAALFIFVAIGVFLIVRSTMVKNSYEKLILLEDRLMVKSKSKKNVVKQDEYISPEAETVMSVYWQTVTCIFLIWSFLTFNWGITWIIWPIAAVVHAVLEGALKK